MADSTRVEKAQLIELDAGFEKKSGGQEVTVQFNPETLKVSFANQIQTPPGSGDQRGSPARQFVGAGTTKLTVQLWFDVNAPQPKGSNETDVRKLTQKVAYFITPTKTNDNPPKYIPPAVRFVWGSFQFDGLMESLEESLEFFSSEGKPLRASVSINMSQQKITEFVFRPTNTPPGATGRSGAPIGTAPLVQAPAGSTMQGLAHNVGLGNNWQAIAAANGIENPRLLTPGQLIDLNAAVSGSASVSFSASASPSASASASASGA